MFFHQTFWPMIRRERSDSVLPIYSMPAGVSQGEGGCARACLGRWGVYFLSLSSRAQLCSPFHQSPCPNRSSIQFYFELSIQLCPSPCSVRYASVINISLPRKRRRLDCMRQSHTSHMECRSAAPRIFILARFVNQICRERILVSANASPSPYLRNEPDAADAS